MNLAAELTKPEYQNMTHEQALSALHAISVPTVGHIRYGETLHLVSMLARGLRQRIENCQNQELKNAWSEALQPAYLASPSYSINVALPEIRAMLDAGLQAGLCTQSEYEFIVNLATYQKNPWANVTLLDVVKIRQPELAVVGDWREFDPENYGKVRFKLSSFPISGALIIIQYCESEDGETWTDWRHATTMQVVNGFNFAAVPRNGLSRRMRWRGSEYRIDGVMVGV